MKKVIDIKLIEYDNEYWHHVKEKALNFIKDEMNKFISSGYEPLGGINETKYSKRVLMTQTMVLVEK